MITTPTQQPEALRLAEQLRDISSRFKTPSHERGVCNSAIEELRRQHAEIARLTDAYCGAQEDIAIWKRRALEAELSKAQTPLTDSEWLEYILRNGSKSDVHIATYEGVATTGASGMVIRLRHDANNLRKLVEAAYNIKKSMS